MMAYDSVSFTLPFEMVLRVRREGIDVARALELYLEAGGSFRASKKANPDESYSGSDFMALSVLLPSSLMDRVERKGSEYVLVSCRSKMDVFVEDALNFYLEVEAYEDDQVLWNIHQPK